METGSRHQCLIYEGAPSRHLPAIGFVLHQHLRQNYRCLYLNSPPMVAGMASCMAASGVDIARETKKGSLILSSEQHLIDGRFDVESMLEGLEDGVKKASEEGYAGFWASGDMRWEFGSDLDFTKLIRYEWRLEDLFQRQPRLSGVCQYHAGTLPAQATRIGSLVHQSIFVNETLSLVNPYYQPRQPMPEHQEVESILSQFCNSEDAA